MSKKALSAAMEWYCVRKFYCSNNITYRNMVRCITKRMWWEMFLMMALSFFLFYIKSFRCPYTEKKIKLSGVYYYALISLGLKVCSTVLSPLISKMLPTSPRVSASCQASSSSAWRSHFHGFYKPGNVRILPVRLRRSRVMVLRAVSPVLTRGLAFSPEVLSFRDTRFQIEMNSIKTNKFQISCSVLNGQSWVNNSTPDWGGHHILLLSQSKKK